eukprot:scaffold74389_cov38-Cyclotella_meneghiniana.AAC.3
MFIYELIVDPNGRSLRSIFNDPGYSEKLDPQILEENERNQRPLVRHKTKRLFMRKGAIPLPVVRSSRLVLSHAISVDGESTWLDNTTDLRVSLAMDRARLKATRVTHRLLVELYEYVRKRLKKPPVGSFWGDAISCILLLAMLAYIYWIYLKAKWFGVRLHATQSTGKQRRRKSRTKRKHNFRWRRKHKYKPRGRVKQQQSTSEPKSLISKLRELLFGAIPVKVVRIFHSEAHSSDTTSAAFEPFSFLPDGVTFVIDNCANAHICFNKKLFIDELKPSGT